jgi:recombination protein RecT
MNAVAQARREPAPIEVLKGIVARRAEDFKMVLPSHITVDKFQRTIATAALANPQLMSCDRQSLLIAAMKLAQDGLLPDGREAALVPFKTWNKDTRENVWMVQAMPMAWGVRKKILQSGQVVSLETGLVYRAEMEGGNFIYEIGMDPPIRHRPKLDMTDEETGDDQIVAAYSIARIKSDTGAPIGPSRSCAAARSTRFGRPARPAPSVAWSRVAPTRASPSNRRGHGSIGSVRWRARPCCAAIPRSCRCRAI